VSGLNTLCDWRSNLSYAFVAGSARSSGNLMRYLPLQFFSFVFVLTCSFTALGDAAVVINSVLFRCTFSAVGPGQVGFTGPEERGKRHISRGQCGSS